MNISSILLSNKKEQAFNLCHNLDEAQRVKEPSLEVYILHDSIYMTSSRKGYCVRCYLKTKGAGRGRGWELKQCCLCLYLST